MIIYTQKMEELTMMILATVLLLFHPSWPSAALPAALPSTPAGILCIPHERDALLELKASLTDPGNTLSSWRGTECCHWTGVVCSNQTGLFHVVTLNIPPNIPAMYNETIGGEISSSLLTLRHLKHLDLSFTDFDGKPIPEFIGAMRSLTYLDLSSSNFGGQIPPHIGNLSNLQVLDLSSSLQLYVGYNMSSPYSSDLTWLSRLRNLQWLNMSGVDLSAAVNWARAVNMLPNLIVLDLSFCVLHLPIPTPTHSNNTLLVYLGLNSNPLNASIGDVFLDWDFPSLVDLTFFNCGIHGPIPDAWGNLSSLENLDLGENYITRTSLTMLMGLERLDISSNQLVGPIPTLPRNLTRLDLSRNNLSGTLPLDIGAPMLEILILFDNSFSGTIPCSILQLQQLKFLDLSKNLLNGTLPNCPQGYKSLTMLNMRLEILDISSNQLVGPIPTLLRNLSYLDLSGNNLSGTLPLDIGGPMLEVLLLFNNSISGTIPCSILQLQQLTFLDLSKNLLNGTLPNCPQGCKSLTMLNMNNNNLLGAFPLFLQRCKELRFLDLAYNKFSQSLPTWIGPKLPQLALLRLRSNMFTGGIPQELIRMKRLQYLDIACNNISGNIPPSLGNLIAMSIPNSTSALLQIVNFKLDTWYYCYIGAYTDSLLVDIKGQQLEYTKGITYMVLLDFSCNSLTGMIPQEIGKLVSLKNLNLSWNSLSDIMPQSIGELRALESFDLSHNQLCGEIPTGLSALTSLAYLNLSYNNLTGTIPLGNQLRTLDDQESIYIGNPGLCGPPLARNCSETVITPLDPEDDEDMSHVVSCYLSMIIGLVVGHWIVFCGMLFKRKWRVACFKFTDDVYDEVYVLVAVRWISLARKFRRG